MDVRTIEMPGGKVALVSEEDWDRVHGINWSCGPGSGYVRGRWRQELGGTGGIVYLHRFIMSPPRGLVVDHIDGDPLNNTRKNLQVTTYSRNVMRSRSGGITWFPETRQWRVRKRVDGRMVSFGLFSDRSDAEAMLAAAERQIWLNPEINPLGTIR